LPLLIFILGLVIGQFLNWAIVSLSPGPAANATFVPKLVWWRRLPVVDAFTLSSGAADHWRVLGIELFSGGGFLLAYLKYGLSIEWGVFVFYLCLMAVIAVIDLRERLILNRLVVPALPLAILLATFFPVGALAPQFIEGSRSAIGPFNVFLFSLLGGAISFTILLLPAIIKPGGMGFGDVKLAGLVGLATGFPGSLVAIGLAILGGGLLAISLVVSRRKKRRDAIPFGPFICAGMLAALLWGEAIVKWYLGLIY
jgi:leader peptidase (prepilin peptidase)/N-methyltransferase